MKKFALLLLVLSAINVAYAVEQSKKSQDTVTFKAIPIDFTLPDSIKSVCKENADFEKEEIGCPEIDVKVASIEPKWIERDLNFEITKDNSPNFTKFRRDLQEFAETQEGSLPYHQGYEPEFVGMHNRVAQFSVLYSEFLGGAHGMYAERYYLYDLELGSRITLHDVLLPNTDGLYELGKISYRNMLTTEQGYTVQEAIAHENYWTFEVGENFYFDDRGLVLSYDPYVLGPYAMSIIELPISYDKLVGIIRPEYLPKN